MTRILPGLLALVYLPAAAAATEAVATEATALEPFGTVYLVCVALALAALLVGFYLYYMRWDGEEDKSSVNR